MKVPPHISHDLECASAAYAVLAERADRNGDRMLAKSLRREWKEWEKSMILDANENIRFRASIAENRELILMKRVADAESELARYRSAVNQAIEHLDLSENIQARTILGHIIDPSEDAR